MVSLLEYVKFWNDGSVVILNESYSLLDVPSLKRVELHFEKIFTMKLGNTQKCHINYSKSTVYITIEFCGFPILNVSGRQ